MDGADRSLGAFLDRGIHCIRNQRCPGMEQKRNHKIGVEPCGMCSLNSPYDVTCLRDYGRVLRTCNLWSYLAGFPRPVTSKNFVVPKMNQSKQISFSRMLLQLTRKPIPVKIAIWVAMTLVVYPELVVLWAMRVCTMRVSNLVKEMNFCFPKQEARRDRVYRSVAPTFVKEAACLI